MMTTTTVTVRRAMSVYKGCGMGWVASSADADGPQDLLWRATEQAALEDGAAYLAAHWEKTDGGWRAI